MRFDVFLSDILGISRNAAALLIKNCDIKISKPNKTPKKALVSTKITNDLVFFLNDKKIDDIKLEFNNLILNMQKSTQITNEIDKNAVKIIYDDEYLSVINKPVNLATHGASSLKEASLVDWLLKYHSSLSNILGKERSGIVHRLDKCTSGALIIAKTNEVHLKLSNEFANQTPKRIYLAIIDKALKNDKEFIELFIGRCPKNRLKQLASKEPFSGAKISQTLFFNIFDFGDCALIGAKLYTGKTHQIRAHLKSLNRVILGDELYGNKQKVERVMLHSFLLGIKHPVFNKTIEIYADFDANFKKYLQNAYAKNYKGEIDEKTIFSRLKLILGDDF